MHFDVSYHALHMPLHTEALFSGLGVRISLTALSSNYMRHLLLVGWLGSASTPEHSVQSVL